MTKASIIIPAYNCENTIKKLVDELFLTFADQNIEIVIINDGSIDNTNKVCINLHEQFKHKLTYARLMKNSGEHNAVMAGLNHVSGEFVVVMDDDLQNPPHEVIRLVEALDVTGSDVVFSYYKKKRHTLYRNLGSEFNNLIASYILKKPRDLYLSSFKALRR